MPCSGAASDCELFGPSSQEYPEYYTPKPYSKSFVLHLDSWYAQSHPDEDFAETFAVWLDPQSEWRERYVDWPALKKLEYRGRADAGARRAPSSPGVAPQARRRCRASRRTLRQHYDRKRDHYGYEYPNFYDRDLRRLFAESAAAPKGSPPATRFLGKYPQARLPPRRRAGPANTVTPSTVSSRT